MKKILFSIIVVVAVLYLTRNNNVAIADSNVPSEDQTTMIEAPEGAANCSMFQKPYKVGGNNQIVIYTVCQK